MFSRQSTRRLLMSAVCASALSLSATGAKAQDDTARLDTIEKQIQSLQAELHRMKHELSAKTAELQAARAPKPIAASTVPSIPPGYVLMRGPAPDTVTLAKLEPPAPPQPSLPPGTFKLRGVTVSLGGFIETAGIYRSRNEVADIASNFNTGIPLPNSQLYHQNELRFSSRQSRISLNASADPDPVTNIDAFFETDFISAAPTANSQESNSYNLRMRHLYAQYNRSDLGLHFLAGQSWSLLTMSKKISNNAGDANLPTVVDAQYVPGFTWARQAQFRVMKEWNKTFALAASLESPQTNYYTGPNGLGVSGTANISNPGGSGFYSGNNYSDDIAPDIVIKAELDQSFGHFEAYGVGRFMHDRVSTTGYGTNNTTFAGGGGGAALLHLIPHRLDFQASFLAGDGIGRYGSAQLPEAVVGPDGKPVPLPEVQALAGFVGHPVGNVDLYGYFGEEAITHPASFALKGKGYGYGSPLYDNAGCETELDPSSSCVGNTSAVWQATVGSWWKVLHSKDFGSLQVGVQYSYSHRTVFQGVGPTPRTDNNMIFFSIRLYPFQDTAPDAPSAI